MGNLPRDLLAINEYSTIKQILNLPNNDLKSRCLVSVIGILTDFKPPLSTKGQSWKCTLEIIDHSIQSCSNGLRLVIFWPQDCMPLTPTLADAVIISKAKAQVRDGFRQLISNIATTVHILPAKNIPLKISDASKTLRLWMSYPKDHAPSSQNKVSAPNIDAVKYAILLSSKLSDLNILPSNRDFALNSSQVKDSEEKFSLLKDVELNCFYNIIGDVRKAWHSSDDSATIYISDYTENNLLFNYKPAESALELDTREGDDFCYIDTLKRKNGFPGPHGKLVIQIALWDEDAKFVKSIKGIGYWLLIENVRVKLGPNGILEGFVPGENGKVHLKRLPGQKLNKELHARWNEALQRKKSWWDSYQKLLDVADENNLVNNSHNKRANNKRAHNNDGETTLPQTKTNKQRRKEIRAEFEKNKAKLTARLQLNQNIQTDYPDQMVVALKDILSPEIFSSTKLGNFYAPFTNRRYRANVRVVDYFPEEIENFAVNTRHNRRPLPSNDINLEPIDSHSESDWEWRFSILLEDALISEIVNKDRLWVLVDNHAAQNLLNIEEKATDLRQNTKLKAKVKEQLFKLWGELEEMKTKVMHQKNYQKESPSSVDSNQISSPIPTNFGSQPDPDSDNEKEQVFFQQHEKGTSDCHQIKSLANNIDPVDCFNFANLNVSNKAFICCIQQYGIEVPEDDPMKSDAGPGKRWQRLYGLFGTKIL